MVVSTIMIIIVSVDIIIVTILIVSVSVIIIIIVGVIIFITITIRYPFHQPRKPLGSMAPDERRPGSVDDVALVVVRLQLSAGGQSACQDKP